MSSSAMPRSFMATRDLKERGRVHKGAWRLEIPLAFFQEHRFGEQKLEPDSLDASPARGGLQAHCRLAFICTFVAQPEHRR